MLLCVEVTMHRAETQVLEQQLNKALAELRSSREAAASSQAKLQAMARDLADSEKKAQQSVEQLTELQVGSTGHAGCLGCGDVWVVGLGWESRRTAPQEEAGIKGRRKWDMRVVWGVTLGVDVKVWVVGLRVERGKRFGAAPSHGCRAGHREWLGGREDKRK